MNKYGIILIGGTISSVVAGSCKTKEEKDLIKAACEYFGVQKKDIFATKVLKLDNFNNWRKVVDGNKKKNEKDIKKATAAISFLKPPKMVILLIKSSKCLAPDLNKLQTTSFTKAGFGNPAEILNGVFYASDMKDGKSDEDPSKISNFFIIKKSSTP